MCKKNFTSFIHCCVPVMKVTLWLPLKSAPQCLSHCGWKLWVTLALIGVAMQFTTRCRIDCVSFDDCIFINPLSPMSYITLFLVLYLRCSFSYYHINCINNIMARHNLATLTASLVSVIKFSSVRVLEHAGQDARCWTGY